jgi:hypothetical protein
MAVTLRPARRGRKSVCEGRSNAAPARRPIRWLGLEHGKFRISFRPPQQAAKCPNLIRISLHEQRSQEAIVNTAIG